MSADPSQLIFYKDMTTDRFFEEAERLGVALDELRDEETHNRVFQSCLVRVRTETAKAVAAELDLAVTDEQAAAIARNSLVPEIVPAPARLKPEERKIAAELYFHAIKAAAARHGETIKDRTARAEARRMVVLGERGLSTVQKLSRSAGCLAVLGMLACAAAGTLLSAVLMFF